MTVAVVKKRTWKSKGVDVFEQKVVSRLLEHDSVEVIEYDRADSYQTGQHHWLLSYLGRYKLGRQIAQTIRRNDYKKIFLPFQELLTFDPSTVNSQIIPYIHDIIPATSTFTGPIPTLLARRYVHNLSKCDLVLCASEQTKTDLLHRTAFDNHAEVVYQGITPPRSRIKIETEYDLLYVGSLQDRKNPTLLRQCFEQATNHGFDCIAVLSEHETGSNLPCEVKTRVTKETLWELFAGSEFYLHPSKQEGFGRPPVEAQSVGTPVIALDTPINKEILGRKDFAWLSVADAPGVTEILQNIDPKKYLELCHASVDNAARFDWDDTCEQIHHYLFPSDKTPFTNG